jgi:predicted AlkP superfamily phosphohydrolase/phosphomutase
VLSDAGKRVIVVNVPVTYPPRQVNGILVGCFLSPSLEKAVYPAPTCPRSNRWATSSTPIPGRPASPKRLALQEVNAALDARIRTLFYLLEREQWDYLHVHIMETDRLHHFLWQQMDEGHPTYAPAFYDFYRRIDDMLGQVAARLDEGTTLVWMADHGFCTIKREVYVNRWLMDKGWLKTAQRAPRSQKGAGRDRSHGRWPTASIPGRVFIRLRGREKEGCVRPGAEYEALRDEIASCRAGN